MDDKFVSRAEIFQEKWGIFRVGEEKRRRGGGIPTPGGGPELHDERESVLECGGRPSGAPLWLDPAWSYANGKRRRGCAPVFAAPRPGWLPAQSKTCGADRTSAGRGRAGSG